MMIEEAQGKLVVIILAAGKASRMNGRHKLLVHFDGVPLVRKIAIQALQSRVGPVVVVTGHRKDEIETALAGLPLRFAEAVDYASGISRSLAAGAAAAIDLHAQAAMIVLADMPGVTAEMMGVLAQTACHHGMTSVVRAGVNGKGGHPIIIPRSFSPGCWIYRAMPVLATLSRNLDCRLLCWILERLRAATWIRLPQSWKLAAS